MSGFVVAVTRREVQRRWGRKRKKIPSNNTVNIKIKSNAKMKRKKETKQDRSLDQNLKFFRKN